MTDLHPRLRFKGFDRKPSLESLESITKKKISYGIVQAGPNFEGGMPYIKSTDLNSELILSRLECTSPEIAKKYSRSEVTSGDIVFSLRGNIGISRIVPESLTVANLTQGTARISLKKGFVAKYIQEELRTLRLKRRIHSVSKGSTFQEISLADLRQLEVLVPDCQEQQKIANFLSSVDSKISQLTEKHRLLKDYKKGVMQQIFSQKIRFKDDDGNAFPDWEEKHFVDAFTRVITKNKENNENVLTISAQKGLVSQLEYFNKSVSAKDVTGYYLLEKGDFAYNKSYSKGYPMGAIKPLKQYSKGVVSTLYICFRPKNGYNEAYFEQYFDAGMLNREIAKIAQEGARNHGLLNVSVKEFFDDIKLTVPHLKEQQKIAEFLQAIDKKIDGVSEQIKQTKEFKKGLLQQMFV
ncbi:restriction endonuclease subunit S [Enterovibrio sp. ZSDZ42]|uniref:Restriction endonuclease subunit S n=1 Tax=Enterovibrio gelatinilyticus TaxID=2899819 RepID=A0ABT5R7K9_9GAMM|nr:restriction endonuclease subunit S [Enterovibrio sp. ZSDZ42]MDD1796262.1 restriction endonuclease subunit S [Enterovibrio sp. ZSDZ42]